MPTYVYQCPECLKQEDHYQTLQDFEDYGFACMECLADMEVVIGAPLLVKTAADVCYDSPIDGRPITNWQARQEDLKRNNCRPYDPEMKTDAARVRKEAEDKLDQQVDVTVESAIEKMDGRTRGKLASELLDQSADVNVVRSTPNG